MRTRRGFAALAMTLVVALLAGCAQPIRQGGGGISVSSQPGPPPEYRVVYDAAARAEALRDPALSAQKCWAALRPLIVADFRAGRLENEVTGVIHIDFAPDPGDHVSTYRQVFQHVAALSREDAELEPVWLRFLSADVVGDEGLGKISEPSAKHRRWMANAAARWPALKAEAEGALGRRLDRPDVLDYLIRQRVAHPDRYGVEIDGVIAAGLGALIDRPGLDARWVTVTTSDGDSLAMEMRDDARDVRSVVHVFHAVAKRTQAGVTFGAQGLADEFVRQFRAL